MRNLSGHALTWRRRSKELVVLVETVEHIRRHAEGLREDVIPHAIQAHRNPNVARHAIIEGKQKFQVRAAYGLNGVKPSLRDKKEPAWFNGYRLFDGIPGIVWPYKPEFSLPFEAVVQFPGIRVPVGN